MLRVILSCLLVGVALSQRCPLSSIPVKTDVVESQLAGKWYEMQWIAATRDRFVDKYTDFVKVLTPVAPSGFQDQGFWRWVSRPAGQECDLYQPRMRTRLAPGKYKVAQSGFPDAQKWIVDTDYSSWMIEFACLRISSDGMYCELSEINLWARQPQQINSVVFSNAVRRLNLLLPGRACLRLEYTVNTQHIYPGVCERPSSVVPGYPYGYPNIYGYPYGYTGYQYGYYGNMQGYGYLSGYLMDPMVITAQKEKLVAEKEKLVTEKEMLALEREKLRLENDILRRGGSIPK